MRYAVVICLYLLFVVETLLFAYTYIFGIYGVQAMSQVKRESLAVDDDIECIQREIQNLQNEITLWESSSFYKEKIARERLNMSCDQDKIYYIS